MLVLYHDFPSAGSLVAVLRLQRLADDGLPVDFRGFDVLGVDTSLPPTLDDLSDWERNRHAARDLGWDLPRPARHPSTLVAHLVGELARDGGADGRWREACYRAHWIEHRDLGDADVLRDLAAQVGLAAARVAALLDDREHRHRLRQVMLAHRGDGIGGVPVLDVNGAFVSPDMADEDLRMLATL